MNNEELILQMLTEMNQDIKEMNQDIKEINQDIKEINQDITEINQDITEINQDITEIKEDVSVLKRKVTNINIHLETETDKNIKELIAVFIPKVEQFDKTSHDVKILKFENNNYRDTIISHSEEIEELHKQLHVLRNTQG